MNARKRFLREFPKAILDDGAAVFVGAGTSMAAGYPSWKDLLQEIGRDLGLEIDEIDDLAAISQWAMQADGSNRTRVLESVREQIDPDYDIPKAIQSLVRLPLRNIWTTNYDRLIERGLRDINRPVDIKSRQQHLTVRGSKPGAVRLYKMHGSIDDVSDIVIATEDYELYRQQRGAFLTLLQAHITGMTFLFMGLSLTDPNVRHILGLIREYFSDTPPTHYAIARIPQRKDFDSDELHDARLSRHKYWATDLKRYGLHVIEINDYAEIDDLLEDVERRVARGRVWVSGSWPTVSAAGLQPASFVYQVAEALGRLLSEAGLSLVSGAGTLVGSASLAGFLSGLQEAGNWDLERRLIVRPFPQPLEGQEPNQGQWTLLRRELARIGGIAVFIGGVKQTSEGVTVAKGVLEERDLIAEQGGFMIPIGATGGAAKQIADQLRGSELPAEGRAAQRPTDQEIDGLDDPHASALELAKRANNIVARVAGLSGGN